jgi:hypothetical protein
MNLLIDVPRSLEAPPRLTRSQIVQKIGSGTSRYPRPGGVLVPRPLAGLCNSLSASSNDRKQCGREIVLRVARAQRCLPPEVLDLEMPHPSTVLCTLPIEDRTRGVLDRLLPLISKEPLWTVGSYLCIPQFGARCLVDLLAAREEATRGDSARAGEAGSPPASEPEGSLIPLKAVDVGRLDDIARLLRQSMPIGGSDLARLLVGEGLAAERVTLDQLASVYRGLNRPAPFRVVEARGAEIAVAADTHGFAATVMATAARMVSQWGVSTVASLVQRLGMRRSAANSRSLVCRLLVSLPRLRWLDAAMEWFSFLGDRSHLSRGIAKIFAVADRVSMRELRLALRKGQSRAPHVPAAVLERYLCDVAGCEIGPDGVHICVLDQPTLKLAGDEARVARLLSGRRTQMPITELTDLASSASLPPARVRKVLLSSPLFLRTRGEQVRLVGSRTRHYSRSSPRSAESSQ